jgi:hypothetical protein
MRRFMTSYKCYLKSKLDLLGTAATPGLLYLPRVIMRMQNLVE